MLSNIGATFTEAVAAGAKMIRLLGNIGWGREGWPNENDILEFEARVTGAAKAFPCVVVCMYDVRALPGRVMVHGAFETHPLTFCGNVMRQNTHYVDVDQFLTRLRNGSNHYEGNRGLSSEICTSDQADQETTPTETGTAWA